MPESIKYFIKRNPFFRGMVRVIDLGCNFDRYETDSSKSKSDWEKIGEDWQNVGNDINSAIEKYKNECANVQ
jgi:hypothetical protein